MINDYTQETSWGASISSKAHDNSSGVLDQTGGRKMVFPEKVNSPPKKHLTPTVIINHKAKRPWFGPT